LDIDCVSALATSLITLLYDADKIVVPATAGNDAPGGVYEPEPFLLIFCAPDFE